MNGSPPDGIPPSNLQPEQPFDELPVAVLRDELIEAFPLAQPEQMLKQLKRGLTSYDPDVRAVHYGHPLPHHFQATPATIYWLERVVEKLWPS